MHHFLLEETRRQLFEESIPRLMRCLDMLGEEQLWWRPNARSNSVGNLILHLEGNARQWILSGLCGQPDTRQRQAEFDAPEEYDRAQLKKRLLRLQEELEQALRQVDPKELETVRDVQIYQESGLSILIHVIEHFSYHTGQVAYLTKMLTDEDTGFYAGLELG
jgi:uncharacterized damage-inducible protein DinB